MDNHKPAPISYLNFGQLRASRPFCTKDVLALIALLEQPRRFTYKDYKFKLAPIPGGGLVLDWPGRKVGEFKAIDLGVGNWPEIGPDTEDEWRKAWKGSLLDGLKRAREFDVTLVAFHGAPTWMPFELDALGHAFEALGCFTVRREPAPAGMHIPNDDVLGRPRADDGVPGLRPLAFGQRPAAR